MGAKGPLRPLSLAALGLRPRGWINDHPAAYRPTIRKLMEQGALRGYTDKDPAGANYKTLYLTIKTA